MDVCLFESQKGLCSNSWLKFVCYSCFSIGKAGLCDVQTVLTTQLYSCCLSQRGFKWLSCNCSLTDRVAVLFWGALSTFCIFSWIVLHKLFDSVFPPLHPLFPFSAISCASLLTWQQGIGCCWWSRSCVLSLHKTRTPSNLWSVLLVRGRDGGGWGRKGVRGCSCLYFVCFFCHRWEFCK